MGCPIWLVIQTVTSSSPLHLLIDVLGQHVVDLSHMGHGFFHEIVKHSPKGSLKTVAECYSQSRTCRIRKRDSKSVVQIIQGCPELVPSRRTVSYFTSWISKFAAAARRITDRAHDACRSQSGARLAEDPDPSPCRCEPPDSRHYVSA